MTVIRNIGDTRVTVEFDDGSIVKNKSYEDFRKGKIKKPVCNRVGEESVTKSGLKMKLICYINCENVDVEFEDGTVVRGRTYNEFKKGLIKNPNKDKKYNFNSKRSERIGIESENLNGMKMTITNYINANDIEVKMKDGRLLKGQTYRKFVAGTIY